jgi:hypothetical protein
MTERNKVIEALEACVLKDPDDSRDCKHCPRCNYGAFITNSCINGVMADALTLLKAQEPVTPMQDADDKEDDTFRCGTCMAIVGETFLGPPGECEVRHNYYPECGRAVKWE